MPLNQRLRERYPILFALGERHTFLTAEEASVATRDDRIRSVWPFAVKRVLKFHKSMKPRDRTCYDPEDMLSQMYLLLCQKDHLWKPERGKYITYAGKLIARELYSVLDRAKIVQSPRNTSTRLKAHAAREKEGTLTERRLETHRRILRTLSTVKGSPSMLMACLSGEDQAEEIERRDLVNYELELMAKAIRKLSLSESCVIGWLSGLWGSGVCTPEQVAEKMRLDVAEVRDAKARAYAKIRAYIRRHAKPVPA